MIDSVSFFAHGVPQPQGSARAFVMNGRARITSDNKQLKDWRAVVSNAAQDHAPASPWERKCGVSLHLTFRFARPASHPKRIRPLHTVKPDVDKLARSVLDALTGILYADDSQVNVVTLVKEYADTGPQGVAIRAICREPVPAV